MLDLKATSVECLEAFCENKKVLVQMIKITKKLYYFEILTFSVYGRGARKSSTIIVSRLGNVYIINTHLYVIL